MNRHGDGLFHPETEGAVRELVLRALREHKPLRVRGSLHSPPTRVFTDAWLTGRRDDAIDLSLDHLDAVHIDAAAMTVRVQAGCRFGRDPRDTSGRSRWERGLCAQLDAHGLALRSIGGITHQTVAGFLATASAGGSFKHSLMDDVLAVRLVDGTGFVVELTREDGARFDAACASLGVLGVVTEVTLRVVPRYWVDGEERTVTRDDAPFSLAATGERSLEAFFRAHDFSRVLWWPQPGLDRFVLWTADVRPWPDAPQPTPYFPMPPVLGSSVPLQVAASAALHTIGHRPSRWAQWLDGRGFGAPLEKLLERTLAPVYRAFVEESRQTFSDAWFRALPQDEAMEESLLPVDMTEVWVPVARAPDALAWLRHRLESRGFLRSGTFAIELYPGPASRALLSPGCEGEAIRINPFFLRTGTPQDRAQFFSTFFELATLFGGRHHWGKHLPPRAVVRDFPRADEFLAVRAAFDPGDVFLTQSLRAQLLNEGAAREEPVRPVTVGPTPFRLRPSEPSAFDLAPEQIEVVVPTELDRQLLFDVWTGDARTYILGCTRFDLHTGSFTRVDDVVDEMVFGFGLRLRVIESEPGVVHTVSADAMNVPFARALALRCTFEEGRVVVRFAVELLPQAQRFATPLRAIARAVASHLVGELLRETARRVAQQRQLPVGRWEKLSSYSGLHEVSVEQFIARDARDVARVLALARKQGRRVVLRGAGMSFDRHALLGDMALSLAPLNGISVDRDERTVTAEAGARWVDVVRACEKHDLLPGIVPSGSDITVGGSASANAMSRFSPVFGKEGRWVKRLELMTPDGTRVVASRQHHADLFFAVLGGLGQLAVVLSVTYELLPLPRPARVRSRVDTVTGLDALGSSIACTERRAPDARTRYAVVAFDGEVERVLVTQADYVDLPLDTMLPHRPTGALRVPIELAINRVPPAGQAFWNFAFDRYLDAGREYVDDLYGFTFFMDGNVRARRAAQRAGLSFRVVQQAFALPASVGDAGLSAFIKRARRETEQAGLRLSLVDVLTVPLDERFAFSVSRDEAMHMVTLTWEGVDGAARANLIREICVTLTDVVAQQRGRVHLVKNVFSTPQQLRAMYADELVAFSAVRRSVDGAGTLGSELVDHLFGRV